ncbi:flagellar biosynthetic protein FliR [Christensenella intestinihominis]|uniref:flagellar biosynthetic protein FliR n=1 Tax=Christensenella intestinihominis TaxID=1851429 RepID=UPI000834B036|nr:flagellar biosynthetic protein FliR [Christensenella intestinihominis]
MTEFFGAFFSNWEFFLLLFLRVSGLIFTSPIFGRNNIPNIVKIGYCACIAVLFFMSIDQIAMQMTAFDYGGDILLLILLCIKELLFGMVLSFVLNLFFQLISFTAGQMIDMQMGFGMVNVFDVQSNLSIPMIGNFLNLLMLMVFFSIRGYEYLIRIMALSIEKIPIGGVTFNPQIGWVALELFIQAFLLAAIVAMPIVASGLLGEACFGIMMRMVPQMNAFSIGIPIKIILGFLVLFAVIPVYVTFMPQVFDQMFAGMEQMFSTLTG